MFLILWNQYYQTSFPMKHYSPFPCSERLEGKEYGRNCVPTKILHQTYEPNAAVDVSNPMESVLPDQLSYETLFTFPVFRTVGRERIR